MPLESMLKLVAAAGDPLAILILVGWCFWCSDPRAATKLAWPVGALWGVLVLLGSDEAIASPERWWVLAGGGETGEGAALSSRVALSVVFFGALASRRGGSGRTRAFSAIVAAAVAYCELRLVGPLPILMALVVGLPLALCARAPFVGSLMGAAQRIPMAIRIGMPAALAIVALALGWPAGALEVLAVLAGATSAAGMIVVRLGERFPIPPGRSALFASLLIGTCTTLALRWWTVEALPAEPAMLLLRGALLGLWVIGGVPFLARKPEFSLDGGAPPL